MRKSVIVFSVTALTALLISTCGSSGGGGDSGTGNRLVDPYVVGAILYEDVNNNGIQDPTEQVSTATDANGVFTFPNALTVGSTIRLTTTKGTHEGVAYTGDISALVTSASGDQVVSPLTTLLANGWTAQNVVDVLTAAGLTGLTTTNIAQNPMSAFNMTDTIDTITDEKLAQIQASISVYCFLSIIQQLILSGKVTALTNGYNLTYAIFISHPNYAALLAQMVTQIKEGLSKAVLQTITTQMTAAKTACTAQGLTAADVTISEIIKGSVAISNYVIPKVVASCDATAGFPACNYAPDPAYFPTWSNDLGQSFYVIRTASNTCTQAGVVYAGLPNVLTKTYCTLDGTTDATATVTCN